MGTRTRRIGLIILSLCVIVTLAAAGLALALGQGSRSIRRGGGAVAVIKLDGTISDATVTPRKGGRENVYAQLRRAERDRQVKAVVLRVNSPGGSATASQALYDQIRRVRASGKPVVVHFTDIAASGGYYVGAAGDRIVAQPATITGSIGVILTSLDTRGLEEKVGVRQRVIKSGPYKDILSASRDITPEERAILEDLINDTLDQFVKAVAEGRRLPEAEVRRIADGRIISGADALNLRLVDELGDQERAVRLAGELAGIGGEPRVVLYEQPQQGGLLGLLGLDLGEDLGFDKGASPGELLDRLVPEAGISVRYEWRGE